MDSRLIELLIVVAIILIIAAIAIPNLLRSKIAAKRIVGCGFNSHHHHRGDDVCFKLGAAVYATRSPTWVELPLCDRDRRGSLYNRSGSERGSLHQERLHVCCCRSTAAGGVLSTFEVNATPAVVVLPASGPSCTDQTGVIRANTTGVAIERVREPAPRW